ncbi:MAG TPA: hypothetical protein VEG34_09070, partial [Thermoanaerobaculia bacterium]|nr:hypothetical protein [Thermoanaerobaculia bacterium]
AAVRKRSRALAAERAAAPRIARALVAELSAGGGRFTDLPVETQQRLATWSVCEELLTRSAALRFDHPAGMVHIARLAVAVAARLDPAECGRAPLADLQARCWAELGNALRVLDDLRGADRAIARATRLLRRGTGQPMLFARLAELTATLRAHQRRYGEAFGLLQQAQEIYEHEADRTAIGRVLIKKGIYSGHDGDAEGAIRFLLQGFRILRRRREAKLRFLALHNLVYFMAETGKYRQARLTLFRLLPLYHRYAGAMDWVRLRGVEGTIAAGLGELDKAERAFRSEREGFQEAGLEFAAAICDLELVTVWLRQGSAAKLDEARRTIGRLVGFFRGMGVEREALGAVLLLHEAEVRQALSVELVEATVRILRQLEPVPAGRR